MNDLVIFGTGGVGRVARQIVGDVNADRATWNLLGFLDEDRGRHSLLVDGLEVLGGIDWLERHSETAVLVAVGAPATRRRITLQIGSSGHSRYATILHPLAWVGGRTTIGENTLIYPGVLVDPGVHIGSHVLVNKACTIGHDTLISDYVTVAPGSNIGGAVIVGEGCELGMGCRVIQGMSIGQWSIVGAGAVVVRNLPENTISVGIPARVMKQMDAGWHESR